MASTQTLTLEGLLTDVHEKLCADLNRDEREAVESGYSGGGIRLIAATMTLAAGVNLPARRVILKHHWVGQPSCWLSTTQVQQMAGRAGRAGLDTRGEVVLIAPQPSQNLQPFADLLKVDFNKALGRRSIADLWGPFARRR